MAWKQPSPNNALIQRRDGLSFEASLRPEHVRCARCLELVRAERAALEAHVCRDWKTIGAAS
jgi:hypothetical protein